MPMQRDATSVDYFVFQTLSSNVRVNFDLSQSESFPSKGNNLLLKMTDKISCFYGCFTFYIILFQEFLCVGKNRVWLVCEHSQLLLEDRIEQWKKITKGHLRSLPMLYQYQIDMWSKFANLLPWLSDKSPDLWLKGCKFASSLCHWELDI